MENATANVDSLHSASPSAAPHPRLAPYKYPTYDLKSAIEVARKVHERGGGLASQTELAQYLGYSGIRNGAFISRVAAARLFGLIEGPTSRLTLTPRATSILQPDYEVTGLRARLEAFCAAPLYSAFLREYEGKPLPPETGMQNALMTRFGIQAKQAPAVLERLLDSAEEAGLFRVAGSRTKMIVPTFGEAQPPRTDSPGRTIAMDRNRSSGRTNGGGGGGGRQDSGAREYPTLILGALEELPEDTWDEDEMQEWLELFERVLRVVYKLPRNRSGADR